MNQGGEKSTDIYHPKLLLVLSGLFLLVVLCLVILLASGSLKYSLSGPFIFVIYIICGLLVAVSCFGILSSSGEMSGRNYGVEWRLGGAIVGFAIVVVGGGLYEIYVRPDPTSAPVDMQFVFLESNNGDAAEVSGELKIVIGTEKEFINLDGSGFATIRNRSSDWQNKKVRIFLRSDQWELHGDNSREVNLTEQETIYLDVDRKPTFSSYEEADLSIFISGGISDMMVDGERTFTIYSSAVALSERPIPIRGQCDVVLTLNGLELRRLSAEVTDGTTSGLIKLTPNKPVDLYINGMLPSDWEFLLNRNTDAYIDFYFHDFDRPAMKAISSDFFVLNRRFLGIGNTD